MHAVGRIATKIGKILNKTNIVKSDADKFTDLVKNQYLHFQTESFETQIEKTKIDVFWYKISQITDQHENLKFKELGKLALAVLSVSHGNAVPERGFSLNKQILQNRELLGENTIEAIRIVKDSLNLLDNIEDFPINRALFRVSIKFLSF